MLLLRSAVLIPVIVPPMIVVFISIGILWIIFLSVVVTLVIVSGG